MASGSHSQDDIRLMLRFAAGDQEGFNALVARHKDAAYRLALRFLRDPEHAEEVASEAFVRVWRSGNSYQPTASFSTWFYRIVVNLCYNRLRHFKTLEVRLRASPRESAQGLLSTAAPSAGTPADELAAREMNQLLQQAILELPESQRMALLLSRVEGLSYTESAAAMGTTPKAVKSLMARARSALKLKLERYL